VEGLTEVKTFDCNTGMMCLMMMAEDGSNLWPSETLEAAMFVRTCDRERSSCRSHRRWW